MKTLGFLGLVILVNSALFLLLQLVYFRCVKVQKLITTLLVLAAGSALVTVGVCWRWWDSLPLAPSERVLALVGGLATYGGLSGIYVLVGPASADRSVSAHIAIHLLRAPNGCLAPEELLKRYDPQVIFQKRFRELEAVGVATRAHGAIHITDKGRRIAAIYVALLKALRLEENF